MFQYSLLGCLAFSGKAAVPRITPDGYNANLNESKVELRCLLPSGTRIVLWFINTVSIFQTEDQNLRERGICINTGSRVAGYSTYVPIFIEPKAENDNITIQCEAITNTASLKKSPEVVFRVQGQWSGSVRFANHLFPIPGLLDPPTSPEISRHNATHQVLRWTPPFTLDLTVILSSFLPKRQN